LFDVSGSVPSAVCNFYITMPGKCKFHDLWLRIESYDWLACHPKHEGMAICTLCSKDFDVSNMEEAALMSHAKGSNHTLVSLVCFGCSSPKPQWIAASDYCSSALIWAS
jgi:hypothetical protein